MIPQILIILLVGLGLGQHLVKHGSRRTGRYNAWWMLFGSVIELWILYAGGFFDVMIAGAR